MALTTALLCLAPAAAHAADELDVSWDGQSWSEQLTEPMFDPAVRSVPGDIAIKEFYVRNNAEGGANLTIAAIAVDDDYLLRNEDIRLSARVAPDEWVSLERTENNFRLNDNALPAGEVRKVEVRAYFDSESPNRSQDKELALTFRVTLSDAQVETEDPSRPLPQTGASSTGWPILAAGTAIGIGIALHWMRKREETEYETAH